MAAMRETQRSAMELFRGRGFDQVTVDEIAETVGIAASTIYRHFGTKEDIVLWDEHEVSLDEALGERLVRQPPLQAIRDAFVDTLASRYDSDLDFQLARIKYIYATEALHAAAIEADFRSRDQLTDAVRHFLSRKNKSAAPVIAGAALLALDIAIDRWQELNAGRALGDLITEAFAVLAELDSIT